MWGGGWGGGVRLAPRGSVEGTDLTEPGGLASRVEGFPAPEVRGQPPVLGRGPLGMMCQDADVTLVA